MTKNIVIVGGSLFQEMKFENGRFIPTSFNTVANLSKDYNIDNYSTDKMTSIIAKKLVDKLILDSNYSQCILALGENDFNDSYSFRKNLNYIIRKLQTNDIRVILVSLPKEVMYNPKAILIQEILDNIAIQYNIDYIYYGKNDKIVSYTVIKENDLKNAIINLC